MSANLPKNRSKKILLAVVLLLLLGLSATAITIFRESTVSSQVDNLFNPSRQFIPDTAKDNVLLPPIIGVFKQQSFSPMKVNSAGILGTDANYLSPNGSLINLQIWFIPDENTRRAWLTSRNSLGDVVPETRIHLNAPVPYKYSEYVGWNISHYEFTWANANWVLIASSDSLAGEENAGVLLRFVNSYSH